MDIKQEIAELKAKLANLEAEVSKMEENTEFDCYFGYGNVIDDDGSIYDGVPPFSENDYTCIRHKEVAEQAAPLVQIQRALMNFKCEHDPVFDWKCSDSHWNWDFHHGTTNINFINWEDVHTMFSVWFTTKKLAEAALAMLKRRKLI